jgi:glyoxylase-like metal-dependent hydrolase (beta-lactamase superfamily II)
MEYEVVTYQIPVPLGDCSVHLLVKDDKIDKAFVMDGGRSAGGVKPVTQIVKALTHIDKKYGAEWHLGAWVVTHWDADHWNGIFDFCLQSRISQKAQTRDYFVKEPMLYCGSEPKDRKKRKVATDLVSI